MSTFRLLARTFPSAPTRSRSFQQTPTSHDWHVQPFVKDQLAFRLSGAPSVRPDSLAEICASSKPVKPIAPKACCQPAEITGFPPDFNSSGSFHPDLDPWRGSLQRARKRSPAQNGPENRPMPRRKTVKKLKIAWRFCSTRKPFRELCPRMRTPAKMGLSWRLTILDATSCCADAANSSDTQSLVLGQSFIPELPKARKRRIKKVTCSAQRRLLAVKRRSCDPDFHAA